MTARLTPFKAGARDILGLPLLLGLAATTQADIDPMARMTAVTQDISEATNGRLNLSGYINGHYMTHDGLPDLVNKHLNHALWQIREASLFADVVITDSLLFSTELEMSYSFTDKEHSGRKDSFEALLNYYYFDFDVSNALGWDTDEVGALHIRAGRVLVPFLSYNENKPNFKQNLMSQPFTAWQLAPVNNVAIDFQQFGWTDLGAILNWNYAFDEAGLFDVKFSVINGLGTKSAVLDNNTVQLNSPGMMKPTVRPRDGLVNARSDWDEFSDVNDEPALVLKASFVPAAIPLNIGVSWYQGAWDKEGDHDLTMVGVHLDYLQRNWNIKGEYVEADVEQQAGINVVSAMGPAMINVSTGDYTMSSWYLEGAYVPFRYGSDNEKFLKTIIRLDEVDTNDKALFTPFDRERLTLGLEWNFMHNIRLRYEWQRHKIHDFDNAPGPYIAAGGEEEVTMNMISLIAHF
ncbi:MAG: hypothetical protein COA42_14520 [Alteromonadaceae bacterium]|nr:MAG: hypothetical protein COA42_14520 [Alteromonadaceae bacterium]